jgi:hypothetical protein
VGKNRVLRAWWSLLRRRLSVIRGVGIVLLGRLARRGHVERSSCEIMKERPEDRRGGLKV